MKYTRFYLEYPNKTENHKATRKNLGKHEGNVLALFFENYSPFGTYDCLSATFFYPNSPVSSGGVNREYLTDNCKRISEKQARKIHPALFERLDQVN